MANFETYRHLITAATIAVTLTTGASFAASQESSEQNARKYTESELIEIMKNAPAAPNPEARRFSPEESASAEHRAIVEFDLTTGELLTSPASEGFATPPSDLPFIPGDLGPAPDGIGDLISPDGNRVGDPQMATAPTPRLDTITHPFDTVAKMLMRFNVDDTDYFYVCSAWTAGSFHVVTAGHCVYNWDPDNDGDTSDAKWANETWLWLGQTDQVEPFGTPDRPFGEAKAVTLRSYVGWTQSQNFDHDWAVVTLNRRDGDHTGWMGRETADSNSLNFTGYPVETPYVPAGTLVQYYGYDVDNVLDYTDERIELDAFIYGGHSGGPSWRYDGTSRWVQGIHSTSNRVGYAEDTRLTVGKRNDLNDFMADDEVIRPPVARPDLIEYVHDLSAKDLLDNTAAQGETFDVEYNVLNSGFAASGNFTIDFYLSTNTIISSGDTLVGSRSLSLNAYQFSNPTTSLTVPATLAPGDYYVGWIIGSGVTEYTDDNNTVVISSETLTVEFGDIELDAPQPGNAGILNTFDLSGADPGATVTLVFSPNLGSFSVPGCVGTSLDLSGPTIIDTAIVDSDGNVTLDVFVPGAASGNTGHFQVVELSSCRVSDLESYTFS